MTFNKIVIKIEAAKENKGLVSECIDYVIAKADDYTLKELNYLLSKFREILILNK